MKTTTKERIEVLARLQRLGIDLETGDKLRRIAGTLRTWFEYECGTERNGRSVSIEREGGADDGKPMMRIQYATSSGYVDRQYPVADREAGARKRLAAIMAPHKRRLIAYIQGDCRGASLYLLRKSDVKPGESLDSIYTRGIAVY